jgi:hypothetical protein
MAFSLPRFAHAPAPPWVVVWAAIGIIGVNYALYLPYLTFEGWSWLRFLLPAIFSMFVLLAAALDRLRLMIAARRPSLQFVAVVPLLLVVAWPRQELDAFLEALPGYARVNLMGAYLREALPANAVVLTALQSAAVSYYTKRPIIRVDAVEPEMLDRIVDDLQRVGYRPFFIFDEAMEVAAFRDRYKRSRYGNLDWPPRAEFWSSTPMLLFDVADRDGHLSGERYPTDVVEPPGAIPHAVRVRHVASAPGSVMPPFHESLAFRRTLELTYRDRLGRPAGTTAVDPESAVRYVQRYVRYRAHHCSHAEATARVFAQIDGQPAAMVCRQTNGLAFPPRDEVAEFRIRLEAKYRDQRRALISATYLDLEGDAIWTLEYLRHRLEDCSADQAAARVVRQILGQPQSSPC